ncbi:MAG TPA: hypothetical protein VHC86_00015 [Opitutaceae bacterium]|nr:hypothetical protein [Opitutaceae bacterium]
MRLIVPLMAVLLLIGCDTAFAKSSGSSRRHNVAADEQTAYRACRGELAHLGFHITGGSVSERKIEAVRGEGANQLSAVIELQASFGAGTDLVLRLNKADNSLSDSFFQGVEDELAAARR